MSGGESIHGTAIAIDGQAILIRGASGSGKSRLAADLLFHASEAGRDAALIGDDRVTLRREGNTIIVGGHPAIEGLMEIRGHGIIEMRRKSHAKLAWLIDISGDGERLPSRGEAIADVMGIAIRTFNVSTGTVSATALLGQMLRTPAFVSKL